MGVCRVPLFLSLSLALSLTNEATSSRRSVPCPELRALLDGTECSTSAPSFFFFFLLDRVSFRTAATRRART